MCRCPMAVDGEEFQQGGFYAKYNTLEVLGNGSFCVVRKCVCKKTGREYAVKIIEQTSDEAIQEMVEADIAASKHLPQHPHIIFLHDFFQSPVHVFLVLELGGCELFDYLSQRVKLTEKKTRSLMAQLFQAVDHMHKYNVIHRDLKPENILLDKDGALKISNFWLATIVKDGELLTKVVGTPSYWAPEMIPEWSVGQEVSGGYGKEIDLWACGVLMYTLLAGFPPFWHRKRWLMLRNIERCQYEFLSPGWDDISAEPKDLIRKLLVSNPLARLTAREALQHPWIRSVQFTPDVKKKFKRRPSRYDPLKRFRVIVYCITACRFLLTLKKPPIYVNMSKLSDNPYGYKHIRRSLDGCAFNMYGHWVKHGEEQSRAALFEAIPKCHHMSSSSDETVFTKSPKQQRVQIIHKALKRTYSVVD